MGRVGLVGVSEGVRAGAGATEALGGSLVVPVVLAVLGYWAAGDAQGPESVPARLGGGPRPGAWVGRGCWDAERDLAVGLMVER